MKKQIDIKKQKAKEYLKGFVEGFNFIYDELKDMDGSCGRTVENRICQQVEIVNKIKENLKVTTPSTK